MTIRSRPVYYLRGVIMYKLNSYTIVERTPYAVILNTCNGNIRRTSISTKLHYNNKYYTSLTVNEMKYVGLSQTKISEILEKLHRKY